MLRSDIIELEKVQRRATKMVYNISELSYEDRLKYLKIDSLAFRRRRCDMLQVYKIFHRLDNIDVSDYFEVYSENITRGHRYKIKKPRCNSRLRQNTFALRIINDWNRLKDDTVNSQSINIFKSRLATEWENHPERYLEN